MATRTKRALLSILLVFFMFASFIGPVLANSEGLVTHDLTDGLTPEELVELLLEDQEGIDITNVTYTGADLAAGTFSGGDGIIGFDSGIILSTGHVELVKGPNDLSGATGVNNTPGDPDLNALIPGYTTYDAAVLEFEFTTEAETVYFQYVFASEEYNEYVGSSFNDVFGFFVNGVNYALIEGDIPVAINNVNHGQPGTEPSNPEYYINNDPHSPDYWGNLVDEDDLLNTQMDGLTVVLTFEAPVNPDVTNTMKLAIADAGDRILDSNVFIKAGSFTITPPGEPAISIEKTVKFGGEAFVDTDSGPYDGTATWQIVVTNTGEEPVYGIEVMDSDGTIWGPFDLAVGGDWSAAYDEENIIADKTNTATAEGYDLAGNPVGPVTDDASVTVMTPPEPEFDCETRLIAGQHIDVGSVGITRGDGTLCVTYTLDAWALAEGWLIKEIHLAVGNDLSAIPQTGGRNPNPIPGLFPYKASFNPGVGEYTICIDLDEADFNVEGTLYIAAHAALSNGESAWGQGERFNERGNWGMYFICGDEGTDGNLTEGSTGTIKIPGAAPEGSMGMPAKHKVDGPTFGQLVSELASSAPGAVAEHVQSKMKP